MNTQRPLLSVLTLLLFTTFTVAQSSERTLAKSFNLNGAAEVLLDVNGEMEFKTWNNPILRVQMVISLAEGNDSVLKSLLMTKRYDLQSKMDEGRLIIFAPNLERRFEVGGKEVNDNVRFIVHAPEKVTVNQRETLELNADLAKSPGSN